MSKFSSKGGLKAQLLRNLDDETNAAVSSMQRTCDELCASIQQRSDHYIALLPPKLRALSVDLFCTSFAGSVTCFQEREIAEKVSKKRLEKRSLLTSFIEGTKLVFKPLCQRCRRKSDEETAFRQ
ncbi:hypothetical protein HDU78_004136 [Chytriomyces hyalinus]|nr:hypothetical protein HDU78_004136 [Chytriomyces hyalinus]